VAVAIGLTTIVVPPSRPSRAGFSSDPPAVRAARLDPIAALRHD
jgi:hypothetical protein